MKLFKNVSLISLGFISAFCFIVACGSSSMQQAMATILGAASDVTYSNSTSGLSSTNVQAAIDEEVADAKNYAISLNPTAITGTWNFYVAFDSTKTIVGSVTFNGSSMTYTNNTAPFLSGSGGSFLLYGNQLVYDPSTDSNQSEVSIKTISINSGSLIINSINNAYIGTLQQ